MPPKGNKQRRIVMLQMELELGGNSVSIAHYYYQNGDTLADPDIVFEF
jgi:hypothetical protein